MLQKQDRRSRGWAGGFYLCSFLMLFLPHIAWAQNAPGHSVWDTHAIPLFRHLNFPRDLPSTATVITQDKAGMIWIGTQDGLARWDGYRSRIFRNDPQDPLSLPGNLVTGLTVDNDGTLFVVISSGVVVRYDPVNETFIPLPTVTTATGFLNNAIVGDSKGGIWVGNGNGLSHFDKEENRWDDVALPGGTNVRTLLAAHDGTLWIGTEQGLLHYNASSASFTPVADAAGNSASAVRTLSQSSKGEIWFGKNDGTLGAISTDGKVRLFNSIQPASPIKGIGEWKSGVLAVTTSSSGLNFVDQADGKIVQSIRYDPGRPSGIGGKLIYSQFLDRSGGLWIAHEHGADYIAPGADAFLSLLPSDRDPKAFSGANISALAIRSDGNLWIGSEDSAEVFSPATGVQPHGGKIPGTVLRGFTLSGPDKTWIYTTRGLFLHEKGETRKIDLFGDIPIYGLYAEDDLLWIGTDRRGLVRFDTRTNNTTFFAHNPKNPLSLSDDWVNAVVRDHAGRMWVATFHGLSRYENGEFTQFHHDTANQNSLPNDVVLALMVDREDRIWVGTQGGGIAVLDQSSPEDIKIRRVPFEIGMPSNSVDVLVEDEQGQIWGGTDQGLVRIDPANFKMRSFGANDGLAVLSYWVGSGVRAPDGTLMFGGIGGLTIVHPDRIPAEEITPPQVVATAAHIGGGATSPLKPIILPPADHNLSVEFAAPDYVRSEKITYAYQLAGFDKGWTTTDADHRQAVYTNLPPGQYVLLLRASVSKDIWTEQPTRLQVTVLPAWYQTWLFKLAIALAAIGAIILFVRSRTALLRRRQKELEGQVTERTSEIASLLHNSGEGFLSFGPNLIIDRQYSRACETFLGEVPAGKDGAALLFAETPRHVAFVSESVPTALAAEDSHKRELILSLLPKEIDRRGRRLRLQYAVLENGHLMVVLRDVTTERRLAERVASEHRRLEMIVAAVTDSRDFFDALSVYDLFINSELPEMLNSEQAPALTLKEIYRAVHTFKGVFNQFSFERTPALLHLLEEQLDSLQRSGPDSVNDIAAIISIDMLTSGLNQDLSIIRQALGDEFLNKGGHVTMPPAQAAQIKQLASLLRSGEPLDLDAPDIRALLDEVDRVGSVSLKAELAAFDQTIAQVARRMEKEVAPLTVMANQDVWLDPDRFGPFLRSLIHVFRNCVAHGIEPPETRLERGKEEQGAINCTVDLAGDELRITVSDDGAGIDIGTLHKRLKQSGHEGLTDEEALDFVFRDYVSTANSADAWSGRGVGLAAVRQEVERLGGRVSVKTLAGQGTSFIFWLKLPKLPALDANLNMLRESSH